MVRITQQIFKPFLLVAMLSAVVSLATAQNPEAGKSAQPVKPAYKVIHDHAIGKGRGELLVTDMGIEFKGEGEDEQRHSRIWRDEEIKRLSISRGELRVTVYEAARIPIIPRKAPFTDGKAISNGTEHDYLFRLREGEITPKIVDELLARFNRPIETSVLPNDEAKSGKLLFEIPVFHRQRTGGRSGMLRVYEHYAVFDADADGGSRFWRYSDIRDIGQLGRYKFEIATYEGQFGVDGKSYVFDLKRPMTDTQYESLWAKVYEHTRRTGTARASQKQEK